MIRDFTKSALGFSWALSLLGLKQAVNLLRPNQQQAGDLLAPMTQVAVNQLDDSMRGIYRSGDNLQARTVDLMFAALNPTNWLNPNAWMRPFTGQGSCGRADGQRGPGYTDPSSGYGSASAGAGNGFARAAMDLGQMVSQATSGFTQAMGQATAGLTQAVTGMAGTAGQPPSSGRGPANTAENVPVSNESAAGGWGPMPGDS
jgi:hypothetical protein